MRQKRVYISAMGAVSPVGNGIARLRTAILTGMTGLNPPLVFQTDESPKLPVGEVSIPEPPDDLPRTHHLALLAAGQAMAHCDAIPDAVVIGTTTGGMLTTENHLAQKHSARELYAYHSIASVAGEIARRYRCKGPSITVSTACSSGSVAIKIALEMLRDEKAERILVGGVDSLCRLTYHGFKSLQLIDPSGSRPFDKDRKGMSVGEGAAMMLLSVHKSDSVIAEILGAGVTCDAYHPAKPHPEGDGAYRAMKSALADAGIETCDVDYINLHGTGTLDNDLAEAQAVHRLFKDKKPFASSIKGAFGHGLAASGAMEAVVSALAVADGIIPANTGCDTPDPELYFEPVREPVNYPVKAVLSNSFGFGGNNASVVIAAPDLFAPKQRTGDVDALSILGSACLTGAGDTGETLAELMKKGRCHGMLAEDQLAKNLSRGKIRRLKRLPKMALALAEESQRNSGRTDAPSSVFLGTGWGALSETDDFLTRLFETKGQFPSPTSFVGSVHNSPASHIAIEYRASLANMTLSCGDHSFEQALFIADLVTRGSQDTFWVFGMDETHPTLSFLFDDSVFQSGEPADGGGALLLKRGTSKETANIRPVFFENTEHNPDVMSRMVQKLGGADRINQSFGLLLAGMPLAVKSLARRQLEQFLELTGFCQPVLDYRTWTGEFSSASAVAAVIARNMLEHGNIPSALHQRGACPMEPKRILLLGLGRFVTAVDMCLP